jgi:WD40 repeat protein
MSYGPCLAVSLVRELALYDITTLNKRSVLEQGIYTYIRRISTSECGKILVSEEDRKISIWDIAHEQKIFS